MVEADGRPAFENAIDVVLLQTVGGQTVPIAGSAAIDLGSGIEPQAPLLAELLTATVRVRSDEGTPPEVLAQLRVIPMPVAFRGSQWLDASRAVVMCHGVAHVGDLTMRYSDDSGLRIGLLTADADPASDFDDDGGPQVDGL